MRCYLDSDVILKLSAWGLIDELAGALGVVPADLFVLATARFMFARPTARRTSRYGALGLQRARAFVDDATALEHSAPETFGWLAAIDDVDHGEALLVEAALADDDGLLVSHDKRFIRALAGSVAAHDAVLHLNRRVLCLEQVLLRLIDHLGFERVRTSVAANLDCDHAVRACFGAGSKALEAAVRDTLAAYITDLRRDTGELLAPD